MRETRTIPNTQPTPADSHQLRLLASAVRLQHGAAEASEQWMATLAQIGQYALTLQTNIVSESTNIEALNKKREMVARSLTTMLPRLNQALTGNGWRRKAEYIPLFAATVQTGLSGTSTYSSTAERKTIHVHAVLGNVKDDLDASEVHNRVLKAWSKTQYGTADVDVRRLINGAEHGWGEYITREWRYNANNEPVHFESLQVPSHMLEKAQALSF